MGVAGGSYPNKSINLSFYSIPIHWCKLKRKHLGKSREFARSKQSQSHANTSYPSCTQRKSSSSSLQQQPGQQSETPCTNIYSMAKGVIFRRCKNHKGKRRESKPHEKENHESEKMQGTQIESMFPTHPVTATIFLVYLGLVKF